MLEKCLTETKRAIVLGIGGGGDIIGTVPTLELLSMFKVDWAAGGVAWERIVYDPVPGPRPVEDLVNARPLVPGLVLANSGTRTGDGVGFAEAGFAEVMGVETLLLGIDGGVRGVVESLSQAVVALEADAVIGIDVGGDSLATGVEPGLRSPLCDSILVAALSLLSREMVCLLGVLGYGCDGELTQHELDQRVAAVAQHGGYLGAWGITPRACQQMEMLLKVVGSEASAIPPLAARGVLRETGIRGDVSKVLVNPATTLTLYLDPQVVFQTVAAPARAVAESGSLEEANQLLHAIGLKTELDRERWMAKRGLRDYSHEEEFRTSSLAGS